MNSVKCNNKLSLSKVPNEKFSHISFMFRSHFGVLRECTERTEWAFSSGRFQSELLLRSCLRSDRPPTVRTKLKSAVRSSLPDRGSGSDRNRPPENAQKLTTGKQIAGYVYSHLFFSLVQLIENLNYKYYITKS